MVGTVPVQGWWELYQFKGGGNCTSFRVVGTVPVLVVVGSVPDQFQCWWDLYQL